MKEPFYISYSGLSTYRLCPKKYKLGYVDKVVVDSDPRNAIFGLVMGLLFEWFYARRAWASSKPVSLVMSWVKAAIAQVCAKENFDLSSDRAFDVTLRNDIETYAPGGVETIRRHKLVTPGSVAEFDLTQEYSRGGITVKLGGRADFLHRGPSPNSVTLQDGKGSKYREQYVDTTQLVWYATLHYLKYRIAPDRVGFIYWRFPSDPLQWIDYGEQDMRMVIDRAFETEEKVRLEMFSPSPSINCRRCDYLKVCEEGRSYVDAVRVEAVRVESSLFDLEQM